MVDLTDDVPQWLREYEEDYLTLEEVGVREKITREAVRQRLLHRGIKPRSLTETNNLRERRAISMHSVDIRKAFLSTRDILETARTVGISPAWVRRFVSETIPDYEILLRAPRSAENRYSAEVLFQSLREAASAGEGNLSASAYESFVARNRYLTDGRPRPGKQAMALRYGSWRAALEAADLPANPHGGPQKEFDEADAVSGVVEYWRSTGSPPTNESYDQWQRDYESYPSSATVRKLAGAWNSLLVRAWQIVHGVTLDQDDETVLVPESLLGRVSDPLGSEAFVRYYAADEGTEVSLRSDFVADGYIALERAVRSHASIQNLVAASAKAGGMVPWSPTLEGPAFDVALMHESGRLFVVEVKSATVENLELQLRIGLGQVLRYAHQLRAQGHTVTPVIAIELRPAQTWVDLLDSLGVGLLVRDSLSGDLTALVRALGSTGSSKCMDTSAPRLLREEAPPDGKGGHRSDVHHVGGVS